MSRSALVPGTRARRRRLRRPVSARPLLARALAVGVAAATALLTPGGVAAAAPAGFSQVNLVSDVPGLARVTDFRVSNPWGIALGPTTPVWINNNGTATSEVYSGANGHDPLTLRLVVETPAGPTGIVYNGTGAFAAHQGGNSVPTAFLFNGLDGYTSGWGPTADPGNVAVPTHFERRDGYFGMAIAQTPRGARMYAASFTGRVEVSNGSFAELSTPRAFVDPQQPRGLVPYNVAVFGSRVYVAYADGNGGHGGALAVFRTDGSLIRHLSSSPRLDAPWGMAMAPAHWGTLGGTLLVGNVNNGRINAFDPATGAFVGQVQDGRGRPLVNSGLWGLAFGNGQTGTPRDLLFAAGIDGYSHGLFGLIHPS